MIAEILAPAGSWESLEAAVRAGAGAVYLGGKGLNARRNASNFDDDALVRAVRYCHIRGVKVYLTVNTLVFDDELPELQAVLRAAAAAGVDALITQDLAVAALARRYVPDMPLHASTQMSVHDPLGAKALKALGFTRVVLARELAKEEIAAIHEACDIELECFVHGALCMCVSGQCYLSSIIGGRSGNRGMCAQPCRLPFAAGESTHALSLRDLSLIASAAELQDLGVAALKIEGRMKRPEYVAAATAACREALAGGEPDYTALEAVFSRAGFTRGYYDGALGSAMFGIRRKEDVQAAGPVLKGLAALYKEELQSVPVDMTLGIHAGLPVALAARDHDGNAATAEGPPPQMARTAPIDAGRAAAALAKTGGTPYTVHNIVSEIDEGLMVPASQLNALRRQVLEDLTLLRGAPRPARWQPAPLPVIAKHRVLSPPRLRARLAAADQLTGAVAESIDEITLPVRQFAQLSPGLLERYREKLFIEIPGVHFDDMEQLEGIIRSVYKMGIRHAVVGGLGGIELARRCGFALHGDYSLNIANSVALESYAAIGLADATLSFELELRRVRALGGDLPRGLLAYGYLPLMTARNCPAGSCARCDHNFPELCDRRGNRFFVGCDWQVPRLYNCVPLVLSDRLAELGGVDFLTLYFTRESAQECERIIALYRSGGTYGGEKTRGLYYRVVQ